MASQFARSLLKVAVAQICQNIGWHAVQSSPMEMLVDIVHRYLLELSKTAHRYCNLYGRSEPNLDDLGLAFKDLGILLHELEEYVNNVEPVPFAHQVSSFPVQHSSNFQHAKPGSRELLHRSEWIHEHLPPMHPELEEEESMLLSPSSTVDGPVKKLGPETTPNSTGGETPSPLGSPRPSAKRSLDLSGEVSNAKKSRLSAEEEGRPMREVTSVFMTPSGLVSPAREGKLPDSCAPQKFDSPPPTPEPDAEIPEPVIRKELKIKDIRKDKDKSFRLKKNKLGIIKKVNKKIKTSKKERENKENANIKVEKSSNPSSTGHKKESDGHIIKSKKDRSESKQKGKSEKSRSKELKNKHKLASKLLKSKLKTSKSGSTSISLVSSKSHKVVKTPSRVKTSISVKANKSLKLPPLLVSSSLIKPVPQIIKEIKQEKVILPVKVEVKEERPELKMEEIVCDMRFREESPEPRLVIDDSAEAQARQEMESRLAVLDECIDAVILRSREESERKAEESEKAVDETIDEVVKYVPIKKNEPKDIYEFTDSSDGSLPPTPKTPDTMGSPLMRPKKEKIKTVENTNKGSSNSDGLKKVKDKSRDRPKKKSSKEAKSKTSATSSSPKAQKSGMSSFSKILPEKKPSTPSPVDKKDTDLDDSSSPISSSPTGYLSAHTPTTPVRQLPPPTLSRFPLPPPFIPSSSSSTPTFSSSPFSPIRPIPCHFQPNPFPTPPLFVPPKPEASNIFNPPAIPQPLNLAMSGPNTPTKVVVEKKPQLPAQPVIKVEEETIEIRKIKIEEISEKIKNKDHRKEKKDKEKSEKKDKIRKKNRDKSKGKNKDKNDEAKEKEKGLKEKSKSKDKLDKPKSEKKGKNKGDKKKGKEEKGKEDNSIPKITFKLGGGTSTSGSTRIVIKSLTKTSDSRASSPQKEPFPLTPIPSTPQTVKLSPPRPPSPVPIEPSPPRIPTPPPPRVPTPPPKAQPPPPTPVVLAPPPSSPKPSPAPPPRTPTPPPQTAPPPAQTPKSAQSAQPSKPAQSTGAGRGRGKGKSGGAKRGASAAASQAPARTVVTETLGTIVDESGNKIWICPACTHPDDGSPMIGCDECDDWYHWVCVSIVVPPKEEEMWFCQRCIARQQGSAVKRRRKKHRKDK